MLTAMTVVKYRASMKMMEVIDDMLESKFKQVYDLGKLFRSVGIKSRMIDEKSKAYFVTFELRQPHLAIDSYISVMCLVDYAVEIDIVNKYGKIFHCLDDKSDYDCKDFIKILYN